MMHMLDLGHLPNNGTWSSVFNLCKSDYVNGGASSVWYEGVAGVLTCVGGIYIYSLIVIAHSWV